MERKAYVLGNTTLSVLQGGPENGTPVVFLHGIPASANLWETVLPYFIEKGYRVFAPDLPGYGETEVRDSPTRLKSSAYSLKGTADILAEWLVQLDIGRVWLVAHDIGGGVAQILTCDHGQHFSHLTLSNCIVSDRWPVPAIALAKSLATIGLYPAVAMLGGMTKGQSWRELKAAVSNPANMTKTIARKVFWQDKVYNAKGRKAFAQHLKALSPTQLAHYAPKLKSIELPTLLAWAEDDPNQPWEKSGQYLQSLLPNPEVKYLPNAGHFLQLDQPKEYANLLLNWKSQQVLNP